MADLIDRQELLKHKGNCYDEEGHLLYAVGTGTILLMPTVDAEPVKHGRWIHKYGDGHIEIATLGGECSECGFINTVTPYCPNCGAKMDEAIDTPTDPVAK